MKKIIISLLSMMLSTFCFAGDGCVIDLFFVNAANKTIEVSVNNTDSWASIKPLKNFTYCNNYETQAAIRMRDDNSEFYNAAIPLHAGIMIRGKNGNYQVEVAPKK